MTHPPVESLPLGFTEWNPTLQCVTLALMTFVQEDIPTLAGSLLAARGAMSWLPAFAGCFLGIWMGDALLYALARGIGRPLLERAWFRRWINAEAVARSESWFAQRGIWLLVTSRLVPGTRLPTYLAAGFLRLPFGRFLLVTGLAVASWTAGIFLLAHWIGRRLAGWMTGWTSNGLSVVAVAVVLLVCWRIIPRFFRRESRFRQWLARQRWAQWEFWPPALFYAPMGLCYLGLAIRHRSFTLPSAANPGMFSGGLVGESKLSILAELQTRQPEFTADVYALDGSGGLRLSQFKDIMKRQGLTYPVIIKPDVGQRGLGVKLIRNEAQAGAYLLQTHVALIVQRYAPGPHEIGVFYYRFPHEPHGRILAITEKLFPTITGDGRHTLEELIQRDPRARFMAVKYLQRFVTRRTEVLPAGQSLKLVEAGNHAQGCVFRDGSHLWSETLERRIDDISQTVPGFYIGRYDLRYQTVEELRQGRAFQIVELNGAASEITSIYDSRNSLTDAYRVLFRQWRLVFAIGHANHRLGTRTIKLRLLWRHWRQCVTDAASLPTAD